MIDETLVAYRYHAAAAIENWSAPGRRPARFLKTFAAALPAGGRVLDYGCGIGKDLAWMRRRGLAPEGVDGTPDFVAEARRRNPGARIVSSRFDALRLPVGAYDGVWANAVLMHFSPRRLMEELLNLRRAMKVGGVLGATFAWGRVKGRVERDWIPGRYIACYRKGELARFFRKGWEVLSLWTVSGDGRRGRWLQVLARKKPDRR